MQYFILFAVVCILLIRMVTNARYYLYTICGLLLTMNLALIFLWSENLHCTQYASFYDAFLNFTPHPEELPGPAVYLPVTGTIIRVICGALFMAICFLPSYLILKNMDDFNLKRMRIPILFLAIAVFVAMYIPNAIIGERMSYTLGFAGFLNAVILGVALVFHGKEKVFY